MAHVRDEVTAHGIDATLFGEVLDQDDVRPRRERGDGGLEVEHASTERRATHADLALLGRPPLRAGLDEFMNVDHRQGVAAYEAQGLGSRRRPQDVALGIHDEGRHGEHVEQRHQVIGNRTRPCGGDCHGGRRARGAAGHEATIGARRRGARGRSAVRARIVRSFIAARRPFTSCSTSVHLRCPP